MMKSMLITAAMMIATTSAAFMPEKAHAQVNLNITIGNPPPPPRHEVVPVARPGYIWAPGYWDWDGRNHAWREGHWERARQGEVYQRPEWVRADNGWRLREGGWRRDGYQRDEHREHRERHEDRADHRHDREDYRGQGREEGWRGGHCPPGHAKKGEC
jgi:hypothetical protein